MATRAKYSAFISYSHADRQLAQWLQSSLESYRLPRTVRTKRGIKKLLDPVFLDQSDLGASPNLGEDVEQALAAAETLVVICSPASQKSQWVNTEVAYFIGLGRRNRIVLVLADGTPEESFPRQILDAIPKKQWKAEPLHADLPLAADARAGQGGRRAQRQRVRLAVVAAILSLPPDELIRRHQQRQIRSLAAISVSSLAIMIAMVALALVATSQRDRAETEERRAQLRLADSKLQQGGALLAADRWSEGYAAFNEAQNLLDELGMSKIPLGLKLVEAEQRSITPYRYVELPGVDDLKTSYDGTRLAVLAERAIHVFDLTIDRKINSLNVGNIDVGAIALSEDGSMIAVGIGNDLKLFAAEGDEKFEVPWTANSSIVQVDFALGSPKIFVAEEAGRIVVWTLGHNEPVSLAQRDAAVTDMQTSADDTLLAVAWTDGTTQTCQIRNEACVNSVNINAGSVSSLSVSPDGVWLVTTDGDFLRFWDAYTGEFLSESPTQSDHVQFIGESVMTSNRNGGVTVFDPANGLQLARFSSPPTIAENRVAFSRERLALITSFDNGVLYWQMLFDAAPGTGNSLESIGPTEDSELLDAMCISRDGTLIAGGLANGEIRIWDALDFALLGTIETEHAGFSGLVFTDGGRFLIGTTGDSGTVGWNVLTGESARRYSNAPGEPSALAVASDGRKLAIGSKSGEITILDSATGERVAPIVDVNNHVASLSFSADDSWLAIGTEGGWFHVWSAAEQELREVTRLTNAPDKGHLRVTSRGSDQALIVLQSAQLWDVDSGTRTQDFGSRLTETWHAGLLGADLAYTGGIDNFTVFDADTGSEIATIELGASTVLINGIATSDGGVFAALGFYSADLYRWQEAVTRAHLRDELTSIDLMQGNIDTAERIELLARWYFSNGLKVIAADYLKHPEFKQRSMSSLLAARILLADGQIDRASEQFERAVAAGEISSIYAELVLQAKR